MTTATKQRLETIERDGVTVSYTKGGSGPPLVLVHGMFSDHETNWTLVKEALERQFTVYAIARRGRGATPATAGHSVVDEADDVVALIDAVGEPVRLLGHSYGAVLSIEAALRSRAVEKLILYEPIKPSRVPASLCKRLGGFGERGEWDELASTFLAEALEVPRDVIDDLRASDSWRDWIDDAPATLEDIAAISRLVYRPERFAAIEIPVAFFVGSESVRELYQTDDLASVLPNRHIVPLEGQAHEGMTTAPEQFVRQVVGFLQERVTAAPAARTRA
jgi:pimeloyl-ACP methyl ester carboxylesterase